MREYKSDPDAPAIEHLSSEILIEPTLTELQDAPEKVVVRSIDASIIPSVWWHQFVMCLSFVNGNIVIMTNKIIVPFRSLYLMTKGVKVPHFVWPRVAEYLPLNDQINLLWRTNKKITAGYPAAASVLPLRASFPDLIENVEPQQCMPDLKRYFKNHFRTTDTMSADEIQGRQLHWYIRSGKYDEFFALQPTLQVSESIVAGYAVYSALAFIQPSWLQDFYNRIVVPFFSHNTHHVFFDHEKRALGGCTIFYLASACNQVNAVAILYAAYPEYLNATNDENATALYIASFLGHYDVVEYLLGQPEIQPNIARAGGVTPLLAAGAKGHNDIIYALICHPIVDVNVKTDSDNFVLHDAVELKHYEILEMLLRNDRIDQNMLSNGVTVLHYAVSKNDITAIKIILNHSNVDRNIKDGRGDTPFNTAIDQSNNAVIELLLNDNQVDVNTQDRSHHTPLFAVLLNDNLGAFEMLLNHDRVELHVDGHYRNSVIHFITEFSGYPNYNSIYKTLLSSPRFNQQLRTYGCWQTLKVAVNNHFYGLINILLKNTNIDVNRVYMDSTLLSSAVCSNDYETVRLLLADPRIDVNVPIHTFSGYTVYQYAKHACDKRIVNLLKEHPNRNRASHCCAVM
ncbi:MAG: ankyrin repeat domain-containing protein [Coxiellaceae bacterium]|nr:ankyrin repeat domain-containing protein [Coxiellaceae bacterium]